MENNHQCNAPTGNGLCVTLLPNYIPRCDKHAVYVERKGEHLFVSAWSVKAGDKIVNPYLTGGI